MNQWQKIKDDLSLEMKNYELNTRKITSGALKDYQDYFELVYFNNFCQGYSRLRSADSCVDNITSSGMNVVIQYLMNDNRATTEIMADMTDKAAYRKQKLEGSDIVGVGKVSLPRTNQKRAS